jgi:hypothetical protein
MDPPGTLSINQIASFAEDAVGNVYIVDLGGEVFRIESTGPASTTTTLPAAAGCGDPADPAGEVTAGDALVVLRASVGSVSCAACVCDVNGSGDVTAPDALAVLRAAVGQGVGLDCPDC